MSEKKHLNYKNQLVEMTGAKVSRPDGTMWVVTEQYYDFHTNRTRLTLEQVPEVQNG